MDASCLDDENELPFEVIASFSASRFALPSIPLMILHSLVTCVFWSKVSTKSLHFAFCVRRCGSGCHNLVLAVHARWGLFYGGHLVLSLHPIALLNRFLVDSVSSSRNVLCATLNRTVWKIFSSLWQFVGRERFLRAASTSCMYLCQLAFFRLTCVRRRAGMVVVFICHPMRIGR